MSGHKGQKYFLFGWSMLKSSPSAAYWRHYTIDAVPLLHIYTKQAKCSPPPQVT